MRKGIYILVLWLTVSACTNSKQDGITISVLEDVTEKDFLAKPNADDFDSRFDLDTYPWRSTTFCYGSISSLHHNKRYEFSLSGATALLSNEMERKSQIQEFKNQIREVFLLQNDSTKHRYSAIWEPLVEELGRLQKDSTQNATLFLFSDLGENNPTWFSTYSKTDMRLLQNDPEKIHKRFIEKAEGLSGDTSDLKVIVVYQPRNKPEDTRFKQMKQLYKAVFKELHISIEFTANLN